MTQKQNGNALIFILIAIALLGLLTVSLSNSSSNSNDTGDFEQNQIAASEILTYAKSIENAVQSLLARGCSENEISFDQAVVSGYSNTNSPTDNSCHVFDVAGAGLTYIAPNEDWLDNAFDIPFYSGNYGTWWISTSPQIDDVGTNNAELKISLNFLKESICLRLNGMSKVSNPSGLVPLEETDNGTGKFTGTYGVPVADNLGDDGGHDLSGKLTHCRREGTPIYQFNHVLHAR